MPKPTFASWGTCVRMSVSSRPKQHSLDIIRAISQVEVLKAQRVEIEESIAQMEHKLFQSKGCTTRHNRAVPVD